MNEVENVLADPFLCDELANRHRKEFQGVVDRSQQ